MFEVIDFVIGEMENKLFAAECDLREDNWMYEEQKYLCESFVFDMKERIHKANQWRGKIS